MVPPTNRNLKRLRVVNGKGGTSGWRRAGSTPSGTTGPRVAFGYDSLNRLSGLTRTSPGGATITSAFQYDVDDRLTTLAHNVGATTLALYTYHYDNGSRADGYGDPEGTRSYSYDLAGQLITVFRLVQLTGKSRHVKTQSEMP